MELKIEKKSRHDFFSTLSSLLSQQKINFFTALNSKDCFENTNEHLFQKNHQYNQSDLKEHVDGVVTFYIH